MNEINTIKDKLATLYDNYVNTATLDTATPDEIRIRGARLVGAIEMLDRIERAIRENRSL